MAACTSNDSYAEEIIRRLKQCLEGRKIPIRPIYEPIKAEVRNHSTFYSSLSNEELHRKRKVQRQRKLLHSGFLTESHKPFRTLGKVYLDNAELIVTALTPDVKSVVDTLPVYKRDSLKKTREKLLEASSKHAITKKREYQPPIKSTAGLGTIKDRLSEMAEVRKQVHAGQSFSSYLVEKEAELYAPIVEDPFKMFPPRNRIWNIAGNTLEDITSESQKSDSDEEVSAFSKATEMFEDILMKKHFWKDTPEKTFAGEDLYEMQTNELKLEKWRKENKLNRVVEKVRMINCLLCAIFNMKVKFIRSKQRLSYKMSLELLRTEVVIDENGKPVPIGKKQSPVLALDDVPENTHNSNPSLDDTVSSSHKRLPSTVTSSNTTNQRESPMRVSQQSSSRPTTNKGRKIVTTWDELLNTDGRLVRVVTSSPSTPRFAKPKRYHTIYNLAVDNPAPWQTILQTEKAVEVKKSVLFGKGHEQRRRSAADVVDDIKLEFDKLKVRIDGKVKEENKKSVQNRLKTIKSKFSAFQIGLPVYQALPQMREVVNAKFRERKNSSAEVMKWYSELKVHLEREILASRKEVDKHLEKVSRFRYEDDKTIPFGKEKLCLLVMSLPAYELLASPMVDALDFVIVKILNSSSDLVFYWLAGRKLEQIGHLQKYI